MGERILHLMIKEFIQVLRDPRMKAMIFVLPVIQLLIFGYAVTTDVNRIKTVVMDSDRSAHSRQLVEGFTSSGLDFGRDDQSRNLVNVQGRAWYNPDLKSRNYNVPGVIAIILLMTSLLLTSMAIVREKEIGTMEQLMVTPMRPIEFILGKSLPFAIICFIDVIVVSFAGMA